jgi:hypothetical protein
MTKKSEKENAGDLFLRQLDHEIHIAEEEVVNLDNFFILLGEAKRKLALLKRVRGWYTHFKDLPER